MNKKFNDIKIFKTEDSFPIIQDLLSLLNDLQQNNKLCRDEFSSMAAMFLARQVEHLKSIYLLAVNNSGRDALLIARSMIEGICSVKLYK